MSNAASNILAFDPDRRPRPARRKPPARRDPSPNQGMAHIPAMDSWETALRARSRAEGTITEYRRTIRDFTAWLAERHLPDDVEAITPEHIRLFLIAERERTTPGNAHKAFRNLRAYYTWLIKQRERTAPSPVDADDAPHVAEQTLPQLTDDEMRALMHACSGNSFEDRRDLAIIVILFDNGMRVSGLAGLRYTPATPETNDVRLSGYELRIVLKGGDPLRAPIGKKTAAVVDRYIRARSRHPYGDEQWLWLGRCGQLGKSGIQQMLQRRGRQAGVEGQLYPHRFRRASASRYLDNGGDPINLMHNMGWKSLAMVQHYTKEKAKARGRAEHADMSPADRL